ncbi:hypothetical protein G4B88_015931 [Cannabis sativa]|uniref:Calmodulin-binding domain-containing protein n=1 Tax=Cannabis sativa TaxID=3483 RepID=A0A7J6EJM4_CANSA|nr:hypothetical protein G4B88_015931 [Cannabis sativa]
MSLISPFVCQNLKHASPPDPTSTDRGFFFSIELRFNCLSLSITNVETVNEKNQWTYEIKEEMLQMVSFTNIENLMATTKVKRDGTSTPTSHVLGKKTQTSSNFHPPTRTITSNSTERASSTFLASTHITSQKQPPNYLKPTKSSRSTSKDNKNEGLRNNKQTLNGRMTFDIRKSPSPSSSSFSSKTTSTPPPRKMLSSSKTTGTPRANKSNSSYSQNTIKSTESFVKKEKFPSKTTNEIVKCDGAVARADNDKELIRACYDHELIISKNNLSLDDYCTPRVDCQHGIPITVSEGLVVKAYDHVHPDPGNNNNKKDGVEEKNTTQKRIILDSTNTEEDSDPDDDYDSCDQILLEDGQEIVNETKLVDFPDNDQNRDLKTNDAGDDQQESKYDGKILVKEKGTDIANEEVTMATNQESRKDNEDNKISSVGDKHDYIDDHQTEEKHVVKEIAKPQGMKESQAYNNVIKETASKLMEKRKNKVKALVGAFETVIDYESK